MIWRSISSRRRRGQDIFNSENTGAEGVIKVVVYVSDAVGIAHQCGLPGVIGGAVGVVEDAPSCLVAEVEALAVLFNGVDDPETLLIVVEAAGVQLPQGPLAGVAKGGVAKIVAQTYGFGKVLVESQRPCSGSGKAGDLKGVGQSGAVMVALRLEENLSLVLQAAEAFAVGDAVNVPLEAGAQGTGLFGNKSALAVFGKYAPGADNKSLRGLALFSGANGHG